MWIHTHASTESNISLRLGRTHAMSLELACQDTGPAENLNLEKHHRSKSCYSQLAALMHILSLVRGQGRGERYGWDR